MPKFDQRASIWAGQEESPARSGKCSPLTNPHSRSLSQTQPYSQHRQASPDGEIWRVCYKIEKAGGALGDGIAKDRHGTFVAILDASETPELNRILVANSIDARKSVNDGWDLRKQIFRFSIPATSSVSNSLVYSVSSVFQPLHSKMTGDQEAIPWPHVFVGKKLREFYIVLR